VTHSFAQHRTCKKRCCGTPWWCGLLTLAAACEEACMGSSTAHSDSHCSSYRSLISTAYSPRWYNTFAATISSHQGAIDNYSADTESLDHDQ
jgi:hypothetical protein